MDWYPEAKRLREESDDWSYAKLSEHLGVSVDAIRNRFYRERKKTGEVKTDKPIDLHQELLKAVQKEQPISLLCEKFRQSERVLRAVMDDLAEQGYVFNEYDGFVKLQKEIMTSNTHKETWNGERIIHRALVSDTHLCSMSQQITHLNAFYDLCVERGVPEVLHSGDIADGDDIYPGHKFEVFKIGADAQKDYAIKNYPKRKGLVTKFITGNHDLKWFTKDGYDIGKSIANERDDLIYLGQYYADVNLTDNCVLRLEHPLGKPAYAVSYKTQRKIDNMRGGDKPNILCEGHYHYSGYMFRRNVHAFCVPSFQGPTKFSKRLGLENENGGYILEIHVDDEGTITNLKSEFVPFYKIIRDDY